MDFPAGDAFFDRSPQRNPRHCPCAITIGEPKLRSHYIERAAKGGREGASLLLLHHIEAARNLRGIPQFDVFVSFNGILDVSMIGRARELLAVVTELLTISWGNQ